LYGLASSATAGSQSAEITPSTTANITDVTANFDIALPSIATPTAATKVDIYVWGTNDSAGYPGGSTGNEVISGSPGAITLSAIATLALKWFASVTVTQTSTAQTARVDGSIVGALGFVPRRCGFVFVNNTGATLPTTGHAAEYVETYYN
jgi:hypothetical protein